LPFIHQIIHPDSLVQKKVNFFADYFRFVTENIGVFDDLEIENYLSLIEKIIFQVESNVDHCPKYLDCYFSHPLLKKDNKYLKEFKQFSILQNQIKAYHQSGTLTKKSNWIKGNSLFITSLIAFKRELMRNMFKSALKAIKLMLKDDHELDEYCDDIKYYTNILVSEFLLNDRTKKDLDKVFQRIMTVETNKFPFPKSLIEIYKGQNVDEAKKRFIEGRTFDQQFEGIYNILKEKGNKHYFLFRIKGINAKSDFSFKYNRVTFYHPNHKKLKEIRRVIENRLTKDFFDFTPMLIASVKIDYYSSEIAVQEAINIINREVEFLNSVCKANAHIEIFCYLWTSDFKDVRCHINMDEKGHMVDEFDIKRLEDSPFKFLRITNYKCKNHILKYEYLFIKAISTHSLPDYWHYLETLIPTKENNEKQIIEVVSSILILSDEKYDKSRIRNYIINAILPFSASAESLGISRNRQVAYTNQIINNNQVPFGDIEKEITNPLLCGLFKFLSDPYSKSKLKEKKEYYSRILWELQAQRNSIIHSGYGNENAMILLKGTLPNLINRFRRTLFDAMENNKENTFKGLIDNLKKKSEALLLNALV